MAQRDDLSLLIAAVRAAYDDTALDFTRLAAPPALLDLLPALAARHRVEGLAWAGLQRAGLSENHPSADRLRHAASQVAARYLLASKAAAQLSGALASAGIDHLFVKGPTLAVLAYPQHACKDSCDIDILVGTDTLDDAAADLRRQGYSLVEPATGTALHDWHRRRKESVWLHAESGVQLDLHDRLVDNPALLRGIGIDSPRQQVVIGGNTALATLSTSDLYAYLCVHGASSAWFRLKWLADLDAPIVRQALDIAQLHRAANAAGAGRASALALALLHCHFGRAIPTSIMPEIDGIGVVGLLRRISNSQLHEPTEPTMRPGGTLSIRLMQALLAPGIGFGVGELFRQLVEIASRPRSA